MKDALVIEIRQTIETAVGGRAPQPDRKFHKHDEYVSYGLKTADFRKIIKGLRPRFLALPLKERLNLAKKLLSLHIGDLGHVGIHVVALSAEELTPRHFSIVDRLADDFRSWSHVDHLALGVLQPLLWRYREETLGLLEQWSHSPIRWKRRASVVTFVRKAAKSGEFTDEVIRLCENLIWDEEDIVQKGVGWALKDNLRSAPGRIMPYIKDLRRRGVSSTITLYAIRDLKGKKRQEVLAEKKDVHSQGKNCRK